GLVYLYFYKTVLADTQRYILFKRLVNIRKLFTLYRAYSPRIRKAPQLALRLIKALKRAKELGTLPDRDGRNIFRHAAFAKGVLPVGFGFFGRVLAVVHLYYFMRQAKLRFFRVALHYLRHVAHGHAGAKLEVGRQLLVRHAHNFAKHIVRRRGKRNGVA